MNKLLNRVIIVKLLILNSCSFLTLSTNFNTIKNNPNVSVLKDKFDKPQSLDIDKEGNLYVLVQDGKLIQKMDIKTELVSDFINITEYTESIHDFDIKNDYLYFPIKNQVKRIKLNEPSKIENFIGLEEIGNTDGDFKSSKFTNISEIAFDNNDLLYIYDIELNKFKKANLKTNKIETIKIKDSEGKEIVDDKDKYYFLKVNPKTNKLSYMYSEVDFAELYNDYDKRIITLSDDNKINVFSKYTLITGYCYDLMGNLYIANESELDPEETNIEIIKKNIIMKNSLLKYLNGNYLKKISTLKDIKKIDSFGPNKKYYSLYTVVDDKSRILYTSSKNDNKVSKIDIRE